jgi:magnesium transporter
VDGKILYCIPY